MMAEVLLGLQALLNTDRVLQSPNFLTGPDRVFIGWRSDSMPLPCMTLTENTEMSTPRPCYATSKHRDNIPVIQIDIWVSMDAESGAATPAEMELIAQRVDELLITIGLPIIYSCRRVSSSPPAPDPDGPRELHKALRYTFGYTVDDSDVVDGGMP